MQVYKITNDINNKIYVGATKLSLDERFSKHIEKSKISKDHKLYQDMNKYGSDHFKIEKLDEADTWEKLYELEEKYILEYDCINSGYNKLSSAPTREDWEEFYFIHKKAMEQDSVRDKISKTMKKKIQNGEFFSESHRKHISDSMKGKKLSAERRAKCDTRSIGCYCLLEDGSKLTFHSYRDAWNWWKTVNNPFSTDAECIYQRKIKQSIKYGYYTYHYNHNGIKYEYPKWFKGGDLDVKKVTNS